MGILDGNGHTVRFAMGSTEGCREYGLFYGLKNAEITDLHLDADLDISGSLMCAGVLTAYASSSAISGVSITGSLRVTADGSQNLYVGGIFPSGSYNIGVVACTVDLQTEISMPNARLMRYYALGCDENYDRCDVYGSIRLTGGEVNMRGLQNARASSFCADLSVHAA